MAEDFQTISNDGSMTERIAASFQNLPELIESVEYQVGLVDGPNDAHDLLVLQAAQGDEAAKATLDRQLAMLKAAGCTGTSVPASR